MGPSTGRSAWTVREVPGPRRRGRKGLRTEGRGRRRTAGSLHPPHPPHPPRLPPSPAASSTETLPGPSLLQIRPLPAPPSYPSWGLRSVTPRRRRRPEGRGGGCLCVRVSLPPARWGGGRGCRGAEAPGYVFSRRKGGKKWNWGSGARGSGGDGVGVSWVLRGPRADGACERAPPPRAEPASAPPAPELSVVLEPPRLSRQRRGGAGKARGAAGFHVVGAVSPPPSPRVGDAPPPPLSPGAWATLLLTPREPPACPFVRATGGGGAHPPFPRVTAPPPPPPSPMRPPKQGPGGVMPTPPP